LTVISNQIYIYIYSIGQKFENITICNVFESPYAAHQAFI